MFILSSSKNLHLIPISRNKKNTNVKIKGRSIFMHGKITEGGFKYHLFYWIISKNGM